MNREVLGRLVREAWIEWAKEQPDQLLALPWGLLSEAEREASRRIGERVAEAATVEVRAELGRALAAAETARATKDRLLAERDEARAWVRHLTAQERVLTCVYCGEAYPPGSPTHGAEVLTAHIRTCAKHPMREVEQQLAAWRELAVALEQRDEVDAEAFDGDMHKAWNRVLVAQAKLRELGYDPATGKPLRRPDGATEHQCGGPKEACCEPGCRECGTLDEERPNA